MPCVYLRVPHCCPLSTFETFLAPELRWILLTVCSVTFAELLDSPSLCVWTESLQSVAFSHPPLCLGQFQRDPCFLQTPELWARAPEQVHEGGHTLTNLPFSRQACCSPPPPTGLSSCSSKDSAYFYELPSAPRKRKTFFCRILSHRTFLRSKQILPSAVIFLAN